MFSLFTKIILTSLPIETATIIGTAIARIISSIVNYSMNRSIVFDNKDNVGYTVIKYYMLCIIQMICSGLLVVILYEKVKWDTTILKIIVDVMLFFISFQIQRIWVFKEKKG
jgi:putative flippase GtrA